jgi:hypothetical protein
MIGLVAQLAQQIGEESGPAPDDALEIGRDFPGEGQQDIGIFPESACDGANRFLGGRRLFVSFYFAQVGGLQSHLGRYPSNRKGGVAGPQFFPPLAEVLPE